MGSTFVYSSVRLVLYLNQMVQLGARKTTSLVLEDESALQVSSMPIEAMKCNVKLSQLIARF